MAIALTLKFNVELTLQPGCSVAPESLVPARIATLSPKRARHGEAVFRCARRAAAAASAPPRAPLPFGPTLPVRSTRPAAQSARRASRSCRRRPPTPRRQPGRRSSRGRRGHSHSRSDSLRREPTISGSQPVRAQEAERDRREISTAGQRTELPAPRGKPLRSSITCASGRP